MTVQSPPVAVDWPQAKVALKELSDAKIKEIEDWLNSCAPDSVQDIQTIFVQHARGSNTAGGDYDTYFFCRPGTGWLGKVKLVKVGSKADPVAVVDQASVLANLRQNDVVQIVGFYHGTESNVVLYIKKIH